MADFADKFKLALLVESEAWKHLLGKNLSIRYKRKLNDMVDFIKAQEKILSKPIKDLDDCRLVLLLYSFKFSINIYLLLKILITNI